MNFRLSQGPMATKWQFLIQHVRSADQVKLIRGNLQLAKWSKDQNTNSLANDDDRTSLLRDRDILLEQCHRARSKLSASQLAVRQFAPDDKRQRQELASEVRTRHDLRLKIQLLSRCAKKCEVEIQAMEKLADQWRQLGYQDVFRLTHEEKLFSDQGTDQVISVSQVIMLIN